MRKFFLAYVKLSNKITSIKILRIKFTTYFKKIIWKFRVVLIKYSFGKDWGNVNEIL